MMRHMTYDARSGKYVNTWENRRMMNIQVGVTVDKEQYQMLAGVMDPGVDYKYPVVKEMGVADTGASVCCSGTAILNALKLSKEDLLGTEVCLYAADRKKLNILGVLPVLVSASRVGTGEKVETKQFLTVHGFLVFLTQLFSHSGL